jgi:hypothetical protein
MKCLDADERRIEWDHTHRDHLDCLTEQVTDRHSAARFCAMTAGVARS